MKAEPASDNGTANVPATAATPATGGNAPANQGNAAPSNGAANTQPEQPSPGSLLDIQEEAAPEAADKGEAAPESYSLKAPEGISDTEVVSAFAGAARELGITAESAQKLLDTVAPKVAESTNKALSAAQAQWLSEVRSDAELGGAKLPQTAATVRRALEVYDTTGKASEVLRETGLVNHPAVVRLLHAVGKTVRQDRVVANAPGSGQPAEKRFEDRFAWKE